MYSYGGLLTSQHAATTLLLARGSCGASPPPASLLASAAPTRPSPARAMSRTRSGARYCPREPSPDRPSPSLPRSCSAPCSRSGRPLSRGAHAAGSRGPRRVAQVGSPFLAAVAAAAAAEDSDLPHGGRAPEVKVKDFVGSVQRMAWAKANGCPGSAHVDMWTSCFFSTVY